MDIIVFRDPLHESTARGWQLPRKPLEKAAVFTAPASALPKEHLFGKYSRIADALGVETQFLFLEDT